jgi:hypothetical protein
MVILRANKDFATVKFLTEHLLKFQVICNIETSWLENIYRLFNDILSIGSSRQNLECWSKQTREHEVSQQKQRCA